MIATWVLGLWLAWQRRLVRRAGWLHAKIVLVLADVAACTAFCRATSANSPPTGNRKSQKFYRIINEVPTVLMIGIVILVVVKPF